MKQMIMQNNVGVSLLRVVCLAFLISHFSFLISPAQAQPKKSRVPKQEQTQQHKSPSQAMSMRARLTYPTALDMPEDVVWRRDIYRELSLDEDANAGLYFPVEPQGKQLNLFTYIFKLAQNGYIPVYEYPTDGSDRFSDDTKISMKTILDNFHIFYEEQDGKLKVDNSDIPSAEVKKYYLKESAYYDQANSSFHIKVLALCPVLLREDDFGGEATQYPLFWVRYADLEPFLNRQTVMASSMNNAANVSMDDYFTMNMYRGKIYKTNNAQGKTLLQLCDGDTAKMNAEQKRIESELQAFHKTIFGDPEKADSLEISTQKDTKTKSAAVKKSRAPKTSSSKARRGKSAKSSGSSSSGARVTVRRERH